jgi:FixJ family two-component response regulator
MELEPTVYVVDADGPSNDAVNDLVHTMNLRCESFASGQEFLEAYDNLRPGCVVLEVKVPGINGLQIQQQLLRLPDSPPVIFLSGRCEVSVAVRAMKSGAIHFLEKPFREYELWDAIQEAIATDRQRREERQRRQMLNRYVGVLTFKERQVLGLLSEGKSNRTIARELDISVRTVENRRAKLMKKLGIKSPTELLHLAILVNDGGIRHVDRLLERTNGQLAMV